VHNLRGGVVNPAALNLAGLWAKQGGRAGPTAAAAASAAGAGGCGAVLITVEWATPGVTTVTLTRHTPDGVGTVVRGSPITLSAGRALAWDTEAPLNTAVTYTVSSDQSNNTATTGPVTLTTTAWGCLSDPLTPGNDIALAPFSSLTPDCASDAGVAFVAMSDETYEARSGVFPIIGTRRPRTVTQTRADLTATLTLASKTLTDRAALDTLLSTGHDLLLRLSTVDYGWAVDTYAAGHIAVGKVVSARPRTARMLLPQRLWTLAFARVDAPASTASTLVGSNGVAGPGASWGDLLASGDTWGALLAAGRTWADVAAGRF
jgi:hypothetical protein